MVYGFDRGLIAADPPITALALTRDPDVVLVGSQRGLVVCRGSDLRRDQPVDCGLESIHSIAMSPDGAHILLGGGSPGSQGIVQLRRWPELERLQTWDEHRDVVYDVAWREDGLEWVSVSWDGQTKMVAFGTDAASQTRTEHSAPVFSATYLGGHVLATAGADRTIVVSSTKPGSISRSLSQHTQGVHALAFQPKRAGSQQALLASASEDRTVRFWQAEISRMVRFHRFASIPRAIAWSRDGTQLMVGCDDGTVVMLDPVTLMTLNIGHYGVGIRNLLVDPRSGRIIASGGDKLWSIDMPR